MAAFENVKVAMPLQFHRGNYNTNRIMAVYLIVVVLECYENK